MLVDGSFIGIGFLLLCDGLFARRAEKSDPKELQTWPRTTIVGTVMIVIGILLFMSGQR
jgi:hypothetical protein